ncbi:hypothetical protein DFQ93_23890 [Salmonella enterica subsp. enterica serovar Typhimurium]|nr:hypothetical protein [Salmonella enterica subsp. enterica serovar Typhimurium]
MALQKVQVNLEESLVQQVDAYADTLHVNRTAAVSVLLSMALQGIRSLDTLDELTKTLKALQIASEGGEKCIEGK